MGLCVDGFAVVVNKAEGKIKTARETSLFGYNRSRVSLAKGCLDGTIRCGEGHQRTLLGEGAEVSAVLGGDECIALLGEGAALALVEERSGAIAIRDDAVFIALLVYAGEEFGGLTSPEFNGVEDERVSEHGEAVDGDDVETQEDQFIDPLFLIKLDVPVCDGVEKAELTDATSGGHEGECCQGGEHCFFHCVYL